MQRVARRIMQYAQKIVRKYVKNIKNLKKTKKNYCKIYATGVYYSCKRLHK